MRVSPPEYRHLQLRAAERLFEAAPDRLRFEDVTRAVGGIRTSGECRSILDAGEADMVGIGRPFYAEPDLAARLLAGDRLGAFCESSNRCVPPQQLGMKARCYNSNVARRLAEARTEAEPSSR